MTKIYQSAAFVWAWLGRPQGCPSGHEAVRSGVSLMKALHEYLGEATDDGKNYVATRASLDPTSFGFPRTPETRLAWTGITEILGLLYWTRTWIYQEASTPVPLAFAYGGYVFDEHALSATFFIVAEYARFPEFPSQIKRLITGNLSRLLGLKLRKEANIGEIEDALASQRLTACADPREKVFSAVGLYPDGSSLGSSIAIDYTRPLVDVYIDVMRRSLEARPPRFGILGHVYTPAVDATVSDLRQVQQPAMPSWVADWRQWVSISSFSSQTAERLYSAGGRAHALVDMNITGTRLDVRGSLADQVAHLCDIWENQPYARSIAGEWERGVLDHYPTVSADAIRRALVADIEGTPFTSGDPNYDIVKVRGGSLD